MLICRAAFLYLADSERSDVESVDMPGSQLQRTGVVVSWGRVQRRGGVQPGLPQTFALA